MTEPTTEAKIELLVRSVLEAVDARLGAVRHEIVAFSNDVEQRHHHLLESIASLDARITELAQHTAVGTDEHAVAHLAGELERVRLRVDSLAFRDGASKVPGADAVHHSLEPSATTTGSHQITREELDEISRPFVTRITTQVPIVPDPNGHHEPVEHLPVTVPPAVTPHFGAPPADDAIDLDQLTSLLNERLGSLTLPTRPD
jgi:hypothetical protein